MNRMIKGILIGVGVIVVLWLCAPLLIGLMFAVSSRHQYNADPPHKVTTLIVTNEEIAVTLWRKQKPRAICYEGEYRVIEVVDRNQSPQFYSILSTLAGDTPNLTLRWYPEKRVLLFVDSGLGNGPSESRIDLNAGTVVDVWRVSGESVLSDPRKASATFCFPKAGDEGSLSFTEPDTLTLTNEGILVGILEFTQPKTEQNGKPPAN